MTTNTHSFAHRYHRLPDPLAFGWGNGVGLKSLGILRAGSDVRRLDEDDEVALLSTPGRLNGLFKRKSSARRRASTELPGVRYSGMERRLFPPRPLDASRVEGSGRRMVAVSDKVPSGAGRDAFSVDHSFSSLCKECFSKDASGTEPLH